MRRVWAGVLAVWSTLAVIAVLAWSHPSSTATPQAASPMTVVVQGRNGKPHLARVYVLPSGSTAHAGTGSSPASASPAATSPASGAGVFVSNAQPPHATTATS